MPRLRIVILSALCCLIVSGAAAQDLPGYQSDAGAPLTLRGLDAGIALEAVTEVTARHQADRGPLGSAEVITSTSTLSGETARTMNAVHDPMQLLKRLPGVYTQDFNQGVTSTNVAIRGYNTEDQNGFVKLLLDGIPINQHNGQTDLKSVFPLEIASMQVIQGTNDPRYGWNNVAGNIHVDTRRGEDVREARLVAGSFATVEPQLLYGQNLGPFNQTYYLGYRSSNGFRDNSRQDRLAGSGKWFYAPNQRLKVGLIARGMKYEAESPGFLDPADARDHPQRSPAYAAPDRGRQRFLQLSAHLDYQLARSLSFQLKAYVQNLYRQRNVAFDPAEQQTKRVDDELHQGAIATLTYRARGIALEWGADYQGMKNENRRFKTLLRVPQGAPTRSFDYTFAVAGSYVQASAKPHPSVKIVGAVRADYLWGTLEDNVAARRRGMSDYGVIWQPKLSASWRFLEGQRLYANYGRTYQVGTYSGAYESANGASVDASINDGWEAGLRSELGPWWLGRVAVWEQLASDEVRAKPDMSGDSENIGKTKRYGLDVETAVQPVPWLSLWGTFSPVMTQQSEPGAGNERRRGKELNHVPWFSAKGGVDFRKLEGLLISLWCYAQGDYYLTKENDGRQVGAYYVLNLDARYRVRPELELGLSIQNLTNNRYFTAIWYKDYLSASEQYSPAAPVSAFASATLSL